MVGALIALAACPALPAGAADELKPARTDGRAVVCVRSGGRRVVLARGTPSRRIGGAAASGRRVAWIETRFRKGLRTVVVSVARVGKRTTLLRRDVVHRDRRRSAPWLDVAITDRGELAWLEPGRHGSPYFQLVIVDLPGSRPRRVAAHADGALTVEDARTLRWLGAAGQVVFHDLPRPGTGCPERSRYDAVAENERVRVTEGFYYSRLIQVVRACVKATGEDRVIAQENEGEGNGSRITVTALDRRWVLLGRAYFSRYGPCDGSLEVFPVDARTRRQGRSASLRSCPEGAPFPASGAPVAVTDRRIAAWLAGAPGDRRLVYAGPAERATELDRGDITGLRARGTAVEWTNNGAPRSMELR